MQHVVSVSVNFHLFRIAAEVNLLSRAWLSGPVAIKETCYI